MKSALCNSGPTESADPVDWHQRSVEALGMPLGTFLRTAADSLDRQEEFLPHSTAEFIGMRNIFLLGGLDAISSPPVRWLQRNISLTAEAYPETCRRLAALHRRLQDRGLINSAFHMNKPPGLRLRWHSATDDSGALEAAIDTFLTTALDDGLISRCTAGFYEPESALFGGPASMHFVHQIFSADSLAWLDYYAATTAPRPESVPPWALSLRMVRSLLDGLAITGWEELGVWEAVRDRCHRSLPAAFDRGGAGSAFEQIRRVWGDPGATDTALPLHQRIVDQHEAGIRPVLHAWNEEYFADRAARTGPRKVAAFLVVFHWNRGLLPMEWQAILAEALADQDGRR